MSQGFQNALHFPLEMNGSEDIRPPLRAIQWAISAPGPPYDVEAYIGEELLRPSKLTPGLDKA